jgi:hypothetical protein
LRLSEDIEVQVGLKEKHKSGGHRCISLKVFDSKGGDFVENPDLNMVVVEAHSHAVITELGREVPLTPGPDGLHKKVEIGVNNYSPSIFLNQSFKVYFLRENEEHKSRIPEELDTASMLISPISDMRSERDILSDRIDMDMVAYGEFNSNDLMENSVNPDDFISLDNT